MVIFYAKIMGLKTVFTEHSHFATNLFGNINHNKLCQWYMKEADATIAVSHACKENICLRSKANPSSCFVIPNAVDTNKFRPNTSMRYPTKTINIVHISRLAEKKGSDMLVDIIPTILKKYPNVHFIIGGDGPKMQLLKNLVRNMTYNLRSRVELLGAVPHEQVRNVLNRGHIFLNTSLTETFCMSILEAASCGLLSVSTDVGGIPEVVPPEYAYLAKPDAESLIAQLEKAIDTYHFVEGHDIHQFVKNTYSW